MAAAVAWPSETPKAAAIVSSSGGVLKRSKVLVKVARRRSPTAA